jgi:hypothetical protein
MNCELPVLRGAAQTRHNVDRRVRIPQERQGNSKRKDAFMIRKLILAATAVMALSAGAQAGNSVVTNQLGAANNSSTVQSSTTDNTAALTQMGFFNNGSAGQTAGTTNTSTMTQGFPVFGGAAVNAAAVGQLSNNSNTSTIDQTSSAAVAAAFSAIPTNSAAIGQATNGVNTSNLTQTQNP